MKRGSCVGQCHLSTLMLFCWHPWTPSLDSRHEATRTSAQYSRFVIRIDQVAGTLFCPKDREMSVRALLFKASCTSPTTPLAFDQAVVRTSVLDMLSFQCPVGIRETFDP